MSAAEEKMSGKRKYIKKNYADIVKKSYYDENKE